MKRPDYTPRPRPRRNYASHFSAKSTPAHSSSPFAIPFAPLAGKGTNAPMRRWRDCRNRRNRPHIRAVPRSGRRTQNLPSENRPRRTRCRGNIGLRNARKTRTTPMPFGTREPPDSCARRTGRCRSRSRFSDRELLPPSALCGGRDGRRRFSKAAGSRTAPAPSRWRWGFSRAGG